MVKHVLILLLFPVLLHAQGVQRVGELFDSLKTHPVAMSDDIRIDQAIAGQTMAYSKLYPISIFLEGTITHPQLPECYRFHQTTLWQWSKTL